MTNTPTERWQELCAQAAVEQNPGKLLKLVTEVNRLLDEKDMHSMKARASQNGNGAGSLTS